MKVIKRNGSSEQVNLNKITDRIKVLVNLSPKLSIDPIVIATKVVNGLYDGVTTRELDTLAAETAATMGSIHPDYDTLAARLVVSNLHKETSNDFVTVTRELERLEILDKDYCKYIYENGDILNDIIDYSRDYSFDYFGIQTLRRSYLLKTKSKVIVERPQHLWMRVATFLHRGSPERIKETYDLLSNKYFTHATPTLFNAGTVRPQLSSCFLLDVDADSIEGIYKTLGDCAKISQSAGGIGLAIHKIRSSGSYIRGTNGHSNGIVPMLRVFDATARYVDQCFHPRTTVYTTNGPKYIDAIVSGDMVISENGSINQVIETKSFSENKQKRLEIQTQCSINPVIVSENHQFYTLVGNKVGVNYDVIKNRLEKGLCVPSYIEAKDLDSNCFIGYPIPQYVKDIPQYSEDDCRMYGILLGDGYLTEDTAIIYLNNETNTETINFVKRYLTSRLIKYTETTNNKLLKIRTNSSPNWIFRRSLFYDQLKNKKFHEYFLWLPENKVLQIVKGLIESDGCIGEKEILLELKDYQIIESVKLLLLRLGIGSSGYERNRIGNVSTYKNITTKNKTYCLRIPKDNKLTALFGIESGKFFKYFVYNNILWSRVKKKKESTYKGKIYDLKIENNPSYLTSIGIAHNGGGKRKGSIAIYLEPWHADIFDFLDLKKNHGKEELRARDLFYGLWIPDLFMKRVENDEDFTLFDPAEAYVLDDSGNKQYLYDHHSESFESIYTTLESQGKGKKIKARELWDKILVNQIETGVPYILYKDSANRKSNQQNLGTIKSSNLCTEIIEYTSPDEVAVCNLASLSLPAFIESGKINYDKLYEVTKVITRNLNRVIDISYYPVPEAKKSNLLHRPIGIGVQGLADLYAILKLEFDGEQAKEINKRLFETIYKGAIDESCALARAEGKYGTFEGSPTSLGKLQFDLWGLDESQLYHKWDETRSNVSTYGLRNSLLVAPMPTASTSQILGNNECFEPFTSNIYTRRTLAGEFIVVNKHLIRELIELGLWNDKLRQKLISANGSVQEILEIPKEIRARYRTVWELRMRDIIDMSVDRGPFICQSQSLNLFVSEPSVSKLTSMHFYAWKKGLKTGMYYLRTEAARDAIKFTIDEKAIKEETKEREGTVESITCSIDDPNCEACSG